jgi:hypothetical protein
MTNATTEKDHHAVNFDPAGGRDVAALLVTQRTSLG